MLTELMPLVERLVMAVECTSLEVENISLHMKGISHSLRDLNRNVSNWLKEKVPANASTLPCEGTDPLVDYPATDQVTVNEVEYFDQYGDENKSLESDALKNEHSYASTPFINLIGNEEGHFSKDEYCEEPYGLSSATKYIEKIKTETRDEENNVLLNVDCLNSNSSNSMKKDFVKATNLFQSIDNSNMIFTKVKSAVYSENELEDSSSKVPMWQNKHQASTRDFSQNANYSKRKHTEPFKSTIFVAPLSNTMETKEENNKDSGLEGNEKVLREIDPKSMLEEDNARKEEEERGFLKPSISVGQHGTKSYQKSNFCCEICGKCFPKNVLLKTHQKVHTDERTFKCSVCSKPFSLKGSLISHMRVHTSERPFSCNICDKAFKHKVNLDRHNRVHSGEKPFKCRVCQKAFIQNYDLVTHLRIHTGERPFLCADCGKCFTQSGHLHGHRHRAHKTHHP